METRKRWVGCAGGMLIDLNTVAGIGQASTEYGNNNGKGGSFFCEIQMTLAGFIRRLVRALPRPVAWLKQTWKRRWILVDIDILRFEMSTLPLFCPRCGTLELGAYFLNHKLFATQFFAGADRALSY